jgi:acyl-lipid omega-6 desaturase (Delta-12 desaturase)
MSDLSVNAGPAGPPGQGQRRETTHRSSPPLEVPPPRPGIAPEADPGKDGEGTDHAFWRARLAPYARANDGRAIVAVLTSVAPYLALSVAMYLLLQVSAWLALALALPTAIFLVRTFIIFHDCSHGSFLSDRRANAWVGRTLGVFLFVPFVRWRHDHAVHHASSGDLGRRGVGDVHTLTVGEFRALSRREQLVYQLTRNPIVMLGLGPFVALVIGPRFVAQGARPRMRRSVIGTDIALVVLIVALCWLIGWRAYLLVGVLPALLAGSIGIWLFYVQHQFEDAYWESGGTWNYADAALRGSSFLKLPAVLRFCTGNIGFHHVHHLNARIPSYNLPRAHEENEIFHDVPTLSFGDGMRALSLKLWDEDRHQLVTFSQERASRPPAVSTAGPAREQSWVPRRP